MEDTTIIGAVALMLTAILSIISLYFKSKYYILKELVKDFAYITNQIAIVFEDDKVTEDEFKELVNSLKNLSKKAEKLI